MAVFKHMSTWLNQPYGAPLRPPDGDWSRGPVAGLGRTCILSRTAGDSKPGPPCLPLVPVWPYQTGTPWRTALGERVLAAATPDTGTAACNYISADSWTWCLQTMQGPSLLGLSYGIGERDPWSEAMSNMFRMPTHLYDCQTPVGLSPTLAGKVPNGLEGESAPEGHCKDAGRACYEVPYQVSRTCLVPSTTEPGVHESLDKHLQGRGALSTHVKLTLDGGLWTVLEQLLQCSSVLDRVRTLDLEVHFGGQQDTMGPLSEREVLEWQVQIFEGLLDRFRVVASTLESIWQTFNPQRDCPSQQCMEPNIHTSGALDISSFFISLAHRDLPAASDTHAQQTAPRPLQVSESCHYSKKERQTCRSGVPCIPPAKVWPWATRTPFRSALGDRILAAVLPGVRKEDCEEILTLDNQAWCKLAMQERGCQGLSYGIERRDLWSESLSNHFQVPVQLHDCFADPQASPLMGGSAQNATGPCHDSAEACYSTLYHAVPVCLRSTAREPVDAGGRRFETLFEHLDARGRLSTHLKLSIEGAEWPVLQELLTCQSELDKIRTLHVEFNVGKAAETQEELKEEDRLSLQVRVLERLQLRFRVVGSTIESSREGWRPEADCPQQQCHEPAVHTSGGFGLERFVVSYVHRDLVSPPASAGRVWGPRAPAVVSRRPSPGLMPGKREQQPIGGAVPAPSPAAPQGCTFGTGDGSRAGKPCLPPAPVWPFSGNTSWRSALGERVVAAVASSLTSEDCDGFKLFDDQAWCTRVMRVENGLGLGLSYGIGRRDPWSEKLSNSFGVASQLYECGLPANQSLLGRSVQNGTGPCLLPEQPCYEVPYQVSRACLGARGVPTASKRTEPLSLHLRGRDPLSTHVKIDAGGVEWAALDELLGSLEDVRRIRSLNVKFHMGPNTDADARFEERELLERQVTLIEALLRHFHPVGSTLEYFREGWHPEADCPKHDCREPALHTAGGFGLHHFTVSYIHLDLIPPHARASIGGGGGDGGGGGSTYAANLGAVANTPGTWAQTSCTYTVLSASHSARGGVPCLPPTSVWPYSTRTAWRSAIGERVLAAVRSAVSEGSCGRLQAFGDHVFCPRAMSVQRPLGVALSYGIDSRDVWSEQLSNVYQVPARLYDCHLSADSPLFAGKAPNGTGSCSDKADAGPCYALPYQAFRVCLGVAPADSAGAAYELLGVHLAGRAPLSTYLKLSVKEGEEWSILERLLDDELDRDRLRTLDVELHFFAGVEVEPDRPEAEQQELERRLQLLQRLLRHFRIVGSTLESLREGWQPEVDCPRRDCPEPAVHTEGGFSLGRFTLSCVHHSLLLVAPGPEGGAGGGD